jgi:hypothetical protein
VAWALLYSLVVESIMQREAMLMKLDLVAVLATLNALLRQVSGSLPQIHQAASGLLQKESLNGTAVRVNGLGKANM